MSNVGVCKMSTRLRIMSSEKKSDRGALLNTIKLTRRAQRGVCALDMKSSRPCLRTKPPLYVFRAGACFANTDVGYVRVLVQSVKSQQLFTVVYLYISISLSLSLSIYIYIYIGRDRASHARRRQLFVFLLLHIVSV